MQNQILGWFCSTHTAGILQSKALKKGKILTKLSMEVGVKWLYHYLTFVFLRKSWQL